MFCGSHQLLVNTCTACRLADRCCPCRVVRSRVPHGDRDCCRRRCRVHGQGDRGCVHQAAGSSSNRNGTPSRLGHAAGRQRERASSGGGIGLNVAFTPLGAPEADRLALPVKPFESVIEIVLVLLLPWVAVTLDGNADKLKSGLAPEVLYLASSKQAILWSATIRSYLLSADNQSGTIESRRAPNAHFHLILMESNPLTGGPRGRWRQMAAGQADCCAIY